MAQEQVLWPGWETVKVIGKGGFGSVYEIRRDLFGTTESAALKVITIPQSDSEIDELRSDGHDRASIEKTYAQYMQSIISEYTMMRQLGDCPNIVSCNDVRYEQHPDGIGWDIFIKMELLTPITKVFPGQISEKLVLKAGKDLCNALVMCKQFHVLHRDIKPQNIFISKTGEFKLGDFGIAKAAEHTMGGTKIGTYKYMAPEVYNNQPYGSAADIYSLGLVLYWMLNEHRLPFLPMPPAMPTFSDEEQAKLRRFRGDPIPAPKNGSPALKAIVLKACAFNPADRFASAAEMLEALEQEEHPPVAIPASVVSKPEETQEVTVRVRQRPQQPEAPSVSETSTDNNPPRKTKLWVISIAASILLILVLILCLPRTQQAPQQASTQPVQALSSAELTRTISGYPFIPQKDGSVFAVDDYGYGLDVVTQWTDIVEISTSFTHVVGLKKDGTVIAVMNENEPPDPNDLSDELIFEYVNYGQCDVGDWTDIVAVSAGCGHTVGLKKDGTVVAVGCNDDGQCDVSEWTDIVAVSADVEHTVGLKKDGTVVAVGDNYFGQCNVENWTDIVAISTDAWYTVGLKKDGTVVATDYFDISYVSDWTDMIAVSAGDGSILGLKKDGTVVVRTFDNLFGTYDVSDWKDIVAISFSGWSIIGLKNDGTILVRDPE